MRSLHNPASYPLPSYFLQVFSFLSARMNVGVKPNSYRVIAFVHTCPYTYLVVALLSAKDSLRRCSQWSHLRVSCHSGWLPRLPNQVEINHPIIPFIAPVPYPTCMHTKAQNIAEDMDKSRRLVTKATAIPVML